MTKENNVDHSTEITPNKWHNRSVSFEQYEKILKSYKHLLLYSSQQMRRCKKWYDEAFTKYPNSNPNERKLKDFEIHEKRDEANQHAYQTRKEIRDEIKALEEGILKYGIDIREEDDE